MDSPLGVNYAQPIPQGDTMKALAVIAGVALGMALACDPPPSTPEELAKQQAHAQELAKEKAVFEVSLLKRLKPLSNSANVTMDKLQGTEASAKVEFPEPVNRFEAERAGMRTAQAIVDTLMEQGTNPRTASIFVFVWVQARVRGATGATMYIPYGSAQYDYNNDQIKWLPREAH